VARGSRIRFRVEDGIVAENSPAWRHLNRPELGPLNAISGIIAEEQWRDADFLSSDRRGPTLLLVSDYSGSSKDSCYESLSFLLADFQSCWLWEQFRKRIRREIIRDKRRLSYKALGDTRRRAALVPLLRAANAISGIVFTFLIEKKLVHILSQGSPEDLARLHLPEVSAWKVASFQKLTRVSWLGAMLIACMSAPSQNVVWFTDEDAIAANPQKTTEATHVIGHAVSHVSTHKLGHIRFGTTACDDGSLAIEDLAAIPDLAAGALAEFFAKNRLETGIDPGAVFRRPPETLRSKGHMLLAWLADTDQRLKKVVVVLNAAGATRYNAHVLRFSMDHCTLSFDWNPEPIEFARDKLYVPGS